MGSRNIDDDEVEEEGKERESWGRKRKQKGSNSAHLPAGPATAKHLRQFMTAELGSRLLSR
jgi:hypothetical protein